MTSEPIDETQVERVVDFYGDNIPVAQVGEDELFVPLKPLAEFLGLDYSSQHRRVRSDSEMAEFCQLVRMRVQASGQRQEMFCLPLKLIPAWLFGITTSKVKPELRDKLRLYRREVFDVLWNAFKGDILPAAQQTSTDLTPAEQILQQVEAMYKLAQQQVELERQYKVMADYMRGHVQRTNSQLHDHEQRLVSIELRLDPATNITDEQAAELALAVKNVAYAMEEHGISGGYGNVYSELYRRFRISSYKNLKRARYDEALAWLSERYKEITKRGSEEGQNA
jgi:P22_AR N-terminal domain